MATPCEDGVTNTVSNTFLCETSGIFTSEVFTTSQFLRATLMSNESSRFNDPSTKYLMLERVQHSPRKDTHLKEQSSALVPKIRGHRIHHRDRATQGRADIRYPQSD